MNHCDKWNGASETCLYDVFAFRERSQSEATASRHSHAYNGTSALIFPLCSYKKPYGQHMVKKKKRKKSCEARDTMRAVQTDKPKCSLTGMCSSK